MKKFCAIISGGDFAPLKDIERADYVIACDRGYEYAKRDGVKPDLILGDFDSYGGALPGDVEIIRYPEVKDDTDTVAAVKLALDKEYSEIAIYCALGGRLDHLMANIQSAVFAADKGARVHFVDPDDEIFVIGAGKMALPKRNDCFLSLFALTDACEGVSVKGAKYELEGATLRNTFPLGVSNEWVDDVQLEFEKGIMMVIISKERKGK